MRADGNGLGIQVTRLEVERDLLKARLRGLSHAGYGAVDELLREWSEELRGYPVNNAACQRLRLCIEELTAALSHEPSNEEGK